jgi:hypothetical protein
MAGGDDMPGTYFMNFMLHVPLLATEDPNVRRMMANVNFTLKDENGGMFACIIPPTATEEGMAAIFSPGDTCNYLMSCRDPNLPASWDRITLNAGNFGFKKRIQNIAKRICHVNPFLRESMTHAIELPQPRPIIGTTFNPRIRSSEEGRPFEEDRSLRRMIVPQPNN